MLSSWVKDIPEELRGRIIQYSIFIFFALLLVVQVRIVGDYGMSFDEAQERNNGRYQVGYATNFWNDKTPEETYRVEWYRTNYSDRYYGVGLQIPQVFMEIAVFGGVLGSDTCNRAIWSLRHLFYVGYFYIAMIFLYFLGKRLWQHRGYALLGVVFMLACPRIFVEAFVGIKDGGFLASMIIGMFFYVRFLEKPSCLNGILVGMFAGFATAVRFLGVEYLLLTGLFFVLHWLFRRKIQLRELMILGVVLFVYALSVFALFPLSWGHVTTFFPEMVRYMSHHPWIGDQLFMGDIHKAVQMPRHYLPVWLLISIPLVLLALALQGLAIITWQAARSLFLRLFSNDVMVRISIVLMFVLPVLAVVIMKSTVYSGWRQFYFLWLPLVLAAVYGIKFINEKCWAHRRFIVVMVWILLTVNGINLCVWMVINHPYQNNYFNVLAGDAAKNFQRDGCMEIYQGLQYLLLLERDNTEPVKIAGLSNVALNLALLSDEDRARFVEVKQIANSKYFFCTPRDGDPESIKALIKGLHPVYQIDVFNSIYCRRIPVLQIYRLSPEKH